MSNINILDWLFQEAESDPQAPPPDPGMQPPPAPPAPPANQPEPNVAAPPQDPNYAPQDDVSEDPQSPDMPEDDGTGDTHFEEWRNHYFKESIKGNTNALIDLINQV